MINLIVTLVIGSILKRKLRINRNTVKKAGKGVMKLSKLIYDTTEDFFIFADYIKRKYIKKVNIVDSNKKVVKIKDYRNKKKIS